MQNEHTPTTADYLQALQKELLGVNQQIEQMVSLVDILKQRSKTMGAALLALTSEKVTATKQPRLAFSPEYQKTLNQLLGKDATPITLTPEHQVAVDSFLDKLNETSDTYFGSVLTTMKDVGPWTRSASASKASQAALDACAAFDPSLMITPQPLPDKPAEEMFKTVEDCRVYNWPYIKATVVKENGEAVSLIPLLEKYLSPACEVADVKGDGRIFFGKGFIKPYPEQGHPLAWHTFDLSKRDVLTPFEMMNMARQHATGFYRFSEESTIASQLFILKTGLSCLIFDMARVTQDEPLLFVAEHAYASDNPLAYTPIKKDLESALLNLAMSCE